MNQDVLRHLGPIAVFAGVWEGDKGDDTAPSDDRGTETNLFRERMTFVPIYPVNNHEQALFGLRYTTTITRIEETDPFHEEVGYWLWDPAATQVLRAFVIPRGIALIAGGTVEPIAKEFTITATAGSSTYGICSNSFLDWEFKTVRFDMKVTIHSDHSFSYEEDSQIHIKGQPAIFHHIDKNTLNRVEG
jgi:hypothetical protein